MNCLFSTADSIHRNSIQSYAVYGRLTQQAYGVSTSPTGQKEVEPMISTEIRATTTRTTMMKAIVQAKYGTSEVLDLRDVAKPEIGDSEVLVRVRAAGVNAGDWAIMGGLPYIARPVYGLGKPKNRVRGTDVAGEMAGHGGAVGG